MATTNFSGNWTIGGGPNYCQCSWFKPEVTVSGSETSSTVYVKILPGVIYRSLNPKDFMTWTGYMDANTINFLNSSGILKNFSISGLMEDKQLKEDDIIYLNVNINKNANDPSSAEIIVTGKCWSGFPEPFTFYPSLDVSDDGKVNKIEKNMQKSAIFPIAYLTANGKQEGESIDFGTKEVPKQRYLVRTLCHNILMQKFNYDGNSVTYGVKAPIQRPFFNFVYESGTNSGLFTP
jgi:hypothetical protein